MGNLSLFSKIRGIGRDSRKEQVMVPVTSALEIELTDEELGTIRGGYGHRHHGYHGYHGHHHPHWYGGYKHGYGHDYDYGDDYGDDYD
jgi:hypothetical protein